VPWDYKRHWIALLCTIEAFTSNIPQALITILGMIPPESWSSPDGEFVFVAVPTECAPELCRPPEVAVEAESEVLSEAEGIAVPDRCLWTCSEETKLLLLQSSSKWSPIVRLSLAQSS
jgi:hypothetical protein